MCGTSQTRESLQSQTGVNHIFEIIDRALLSVNLLPVRSHCDVVKGLIDQQADIQFKSDGGEVGYHVQGFERG